MRHPSKRVLIGLMVFAVGSTTSLAVASDGDVFETFTGTSETSQPASEDFASPATTLDSTVEEVLDASELTPEAAAEVVAESEGTDAASTAADPSAAVLSPDSDLAQQTAEAVESVAEIAAVGKFAVVNSASFAAKGFGGQIETVSAGSLVTGFGVGLSATSESAKSTCDRTLAGVSVFAHVSGKDATAACLMYVSPQQINFEVPADVRDGVQFVVKRDGIELAKSIDYVVSPFESPGVFAANGYGVGAPSGYLIRVHGGQVSYEAVATWNAAKATYEPKPISFNGDQLFLVLYGTGLRAPKDFGASTLWYPYVKIETSNGPPIRVLPAYADAHAAFTGLDQVNVELPASLAGTGRRNFALEFPITTSNTFELVFA